MEKELVKRLIESDHIAFKELYQLYSKKIFYVASGFGLTNEDAEGIVQEVFIKVWERRKDLRADLSFNAYLLTITKNFLIKKARQNAYNLAIQKYLTVNRSSIHNNTEDSIVYADLFNITESFIDELPEQQRQIFRLSKIDNLPNKEIAKKLGVSLRTVENHLFRANGKLKKRLKGLGIW